MERAGAEREARVKRAAALSLGYNAGQTGVKLAAALLTGSVAFLTEAFHSGTDLAAAAISFVAVRYALAPPDDDHPYGHGKIDSLAGFGEAILLLGFSVFVALSSVLRFFRPVELVQAGVGAWLVGATSVGAGLMSLYVAREGRATGSAALRSNAQHLRVDALTAAGVVAGVLLAQRTGAAWLDPLVALGLASVLGWEAARLARRAFGEVVDERIEAGEIAKIEGILMLDAEVRSWHRVRTRHSGPEHLVDLHIVVPDEFSVRDGHRVADRIEKAIERTLAPARCVVHVDPLSEADHDD